MFLSPHYFLSESLRMCSFLQAGPPNEALWTFMRGIALIPKNHWLYIINQQTHYKSTNR